MSPSGDCPAVREAALDAHDKLRALNSIAAPARGMLTLALGMYETQNSAEMDGIMTTQQDLYENLFCPGGGDDAEAAARYGLAMSEGWREVAGGAALPLGAVVRIRQTIANSKGQWRNAPNAEAPPPRLVPQMMTQLEGEMHKQTNADPLVRMAQIHHRLRSIQPFDSNCSSTGRVVSVLFLIKEGVLCAPVLYLSAFINRTRDAYRRLLRGGGGREWLLYMLSGIAITAENAAQMAGRIIMAHDKFKRRIIHYGYREDLADALFAYPYITVPVLSRELETSPEQAREYLDELWEDGLLQRMRPRGIDLYINLAVIDIIFTHPELPIH